MTKTLAILQSNYIPWKGYFDIIRCVDEFIIFDDAQYTRRDWRNRNLIKTAHGLQWLTVPVDVKGKFNQSIYETMITPGNWARKHWASIQRAYAKSAYFSTYQSIFEPLYLEREYGSLSELNKSFLEVICQILEIKVPLIDSSELSLVEGQTERLVDICKQRKASVYLSGPAAKNYLDETLFSDEGIQVIWADYSCYPEYEQLFQPFEHGVSILDLLFNTGPDSCDYMKSLI